MELDTETKYRDSSNVNVKDLQANLFPLLPKLSGYFASYLLKSPLDMEEGDDSEIRLKSIGSKDLFAVNRESNFQVQPARWPTECQVLAEPVDHITTVPSQPEPYYTPTGLEMQPKPSGEDYGLIVYQYAPISAVSYFSRSSVGGSKYLLSTNICPEENSLKFESRFESGNLARAIRLTPSYYELYLRSDLYTQRYMQWFYFRVTNMKKNFLYRFSIVNFTKDGSLYNSGLRPLMYSEKDSQLHSIGWRRCGDQITYFCNENVTEEGEDQQMTYTLTFTVSFPHEGDTVYFASCYPYTYTNLQDYLSELSNHPVKSTFTTLRLLCKSLAGNNVDYITITNPQEEEEENRKKRAIVLTARVHPGETPSSWMMKGIIDFLTSDCAPAKELRDKFIFKIVPMLNPDGVIVGNNRCSLSGKDLNRQYRTVMREAYPSIWYTKLMMRRLIEECGVSMYCDLHGHSRKHNIFIYGCENRKQNEKRLQEQIFPLMLHKNSSEKFSFEDCSFRVQKGKEGTGRIVMWMMGITNSYTLEASFAGSTMGSRNSTHFSAQDYEQMGKSFCQTLLDFYDEEPRKEKLRVKILNRLNEGGSCADEPTNIDLSDYSSDAGSSSDPEEIGDCGLLVPPSTPETRIIHNENQDPAPNAKVRRKSRIPRHRQTYHVKPNVPNRKIAPIRKANFYFSFSESKSQYGSQSTSDSEDDNFTTISGKKKFSKSKKIGKKKLQAREPSETCKSEVPEVRSVSSLEILPPQDLNAEIRRKDRTPQPKLCNERRNGLDVDEQLNIVQQRLMALKHKVWYGSGDGQPITWGIISQADLSTNGLDKDSKKVPKKKRPKLQRKGTIKGKQKAEVKLKCSTKKNLNSLALIGTACQMQESPRRKGLQFEETTSH
ncbi:cytosolic carboxypeptidase 2-like isoform X2 [Harmonia axyridis]|uniref:cytosolic carboxypeptidase 2-like isoform X2 n=1 Tax=Harmonia axyridis TaxID=115357 RepID=UPI001E27989F|nr:cytosolic carboxypeptidase 2-like isoform X2 [Harmonia axyridis]